MPNDVGRITRTEIQAKNSVKNDGKGKLTCAKEWQQEIALNTDSVEKLESPNCGERKVYLD